VSSIPRVFPAGTPVARVGEIEIYLLTVESWSDRMLVRLVGAATDATREQIATYNTDMSEWVQRHGKAGEEPAPQSMGEQLFASVTVRVVDDLSTDFRWISGSSGGTGTELLCEWLFEPAIPPEATSVRVVVTTVDGVENSVTVRQHPDTSQPGPV
jgi:hypothetical protein